MLRGGGGISQVANGNHNSQSIGGTGGTINVDVVLHSIDELKAALNAITALLDDQIRRKDEQLQNKEDMIEFLKGLIQK